MLLLAGYVGCGNENLLWLLVWSFNGKSLALREKCSLLGNVLTIWMHTHDGRSVVHALVNRMVHPVVFFPARTSRFKWILGSVIDCCVIYMQETVYLILLYQSD